MQDVDLIDAVASRLEEGLRSIGLTQTLVVQRYQPTQQGVPSEDSVWLEKLFDHVHGSPEINHFFKPLENTYNEMETQVYVTTFQVSALFAQTPGDTSKPTASDVANYLKRFITSRETIRQFKKKGLSFFRVTDVRNVKFSDDMSQFEAFPAFDIAIVHNNSLTSVIGAATSWRTKIVSIGGEFGPVKDDTSAD